MVDPEQLFQLFRERQSTRKFDSSRSVAREDIERIIDMAHYAPSACNGQPWHFLIVDDKTKCQALSSVLLNGFAKEAPVHVLLLEERTNLMSRVGSYLKNKNYVQMDIGIVAAHFCLAAKSMGLDTCMLGWLDEGRIKKLFDIPKNRRVWLDIIIGYGTQETREKKRKPLTDIMTYNEYEK